jgi:DNA-binding NarL/FixJ family response regulator
LIETKYTYNSDQNETQKISIVLADDHPLIRQALRMWIEKQKDMEIVAEAADGKEVVEITAKLNPDVLIMDISMPKMNGLEATKKIKEVSPNTEVLILTVHTDDEHIISTVRAGASGYLTKKTSGEEVIHAIRALADGENLLPANISQTIIKDTLSNPEQLVLTKIEELSVREQNMLKLAANGMSNKEIGLTLGLSLRNVKACFTNIFLKLGVSSRTGAIAVGLKTGIITIEDLDR